MEPWAPVLLIASDLEVPEAQRVWGTGGWLPPEQREALDWLTLARLLGWGVRVTYPAALERDGSLLGAPRWIILACDPDALGPDVIDLLAARLCAESVLLVARAGARDSALARLAGAARGPSEIAGRSLGWIGPGPEVRWQCRKSVDGEALAVSDASPWATLDGAPLVVARKIGPSTIVTLGVHPSRGRDTDGAVTALLKHMLIRGPGAPVAWLDFDASLILRMDDAGGSQNVHLRSWSHPKLGPTEWAAIARALERRGGRLSIGYIGGWVDDGDPARGRLKVGERSPRRVPGRVHASPQVTYVDIAGAAPGTVHDYQAEFRGIQALRQQGLGDVELHGYTHLNPDAASWAKAPDRYDAVSWYRELGPAAEAAIAGRPADQHPLALGIASLRRYFGVHPTTLICPGGEWTHDALVRALDLGLRLVSSYYLALRDGDRFCWTQHVCSPYLDEVDGAWLDAGVPVVGYFHDRDPARGGVGWIERCLDAWRAAGVRRLMDFRELAGALGRRLHLDASQEGLRLSVRSEDAPPLVRPLVVGIVWPEGPVPSSLSGVLDGRSLSLAVEPIGPGVGRVVLPCVP